MDKIVIDIETSNTFADVGGQEKVKDLEVSLVGLYSYNLDKFLAFEKHEIGKIEPILKNAGLVIGFAINRFDIPVLSKYCSFDLFALPRFDLLEEIELTMGRRVGLNVLSRANLGLEKTHHGLEAVKLYREGKIEELKEYCLMDVKLTKELYELAKKQGYLIVPHKITQEPIKVTLSSIKEFLPATLF